MNRFPTTPVLSYCFRPIHVKDERKDIYVPCGRCDGCRLHKANEWSIRLRDEIEATPHSIFFTLTYNNKYLPKLRLVNTDIHSDGHTVFYTYSSDNPDNIRFNSVCDVRRKDDLVIKTIHKPIMVQNYDYVVLNYCSKSDVQLWLKLLRKWLIKEFHYEDRENGGLFRYYIISEYGPTTYRNHYHGIIFPKNKEIAEALISDGLFKNWQMCDESLFKQYCHYCDSGAAGYVTNYVTGFSSLPEVYQENKELRPFRLASKAPSIGYIDTDKAEIYSDLCRGLIHYSRSVKRLGTQTVLKRPKDFMLTLFPKCFQYGLADVSRIRIVYGRILQASVRAGYEYSFVCRLLRDFMRFSDYRAALAAYKYVTCFGSSLEHYLFLLDNYYYRIAMDSLITHFQTVQKFRDIREAIRFYINFHDFVSKALQGVGDYPLALWYFFDGFHLDFSMAAEFLKHEYYVTSDSALETYKREVKNIIQSAQKTAKYNELSGNCPHIV